ncbi:hypothetical protein D9611_002799 [Ephemerocybe angulata]|uniref:F-box domain-containing protein n=1 Tax=Ephemerocybe angulata TaxID=980116 RepID=A0A8H5C153_9AGAR|nr:hypothetical protein D9611_002799 [Tulosesus angulatus]
MEPYLAHPDASHFSTETKDLMDVAQVSDVPKYHGVLARRIQELECELRALRSCHNAVTLTCRLPPEILARIFIDLALMGLSSWYTDNNKVSVSWLRVTFVCRHWRSVALQSPSLWSNLVFSNTNLAEAMLTRSKGAPLTIWYNGATDEPSPTLTTALSSVDRLRSVKVCELGDPGPETYIQTALLAWAQKTGPILTSFEMSYTHDNIRTSSLPKAFLRSSSHSLRILSLIRGDYTWGDLPIRPNITHLSLGGTGKMISATYRPTHSTFVYSLQKMPHLQCLNLIGVLPSEADPQYPEPIYIPSLCSLSLEDDASIIEVSFRTLRVPRGARIDLKLWYFNYTNNIAERVGQTLRELRGFVPTNRAFRKLLFHVESRIWQRDAAHFEFWFEVDENRAGPCLTLSFHGYLMNSLTDYVTLIHNHLGFPDSMSLHLKGDRHFRAAAHTLKTTLGQIPQLKTITFEALPLNEIPSFLESPAHSDSTYASSSGCFPGLTIINCVALDMGALGDDLPEVIVRMLDGHTIREINFRSCKNFRKKCFETMKEKVPSVLFSCDRLQ